MRTGGTLYSWYENIKRKGLVMFLVHSRHFQNIELSEMDSPHQWERETGRQARMTVCWSEFI